MAAEEEFVPNSVEDKIILYYKVMEGCWADLPEELLCLIFSNLFATKDRHSFRLVCRSWNSAAGASPEYPHPPCLMYCKRSQLSWKFHQYNDTFYLHLSEYTSAEIRCSNYGWLLMHRNDRTIFFYDPFNDRRIEVPGRSYLHDNTMHFFHPSTSPDCFIIEADVSGEDVWMGILKHGSSEWERHHYYFENHFLMSKSSPILRDGLLYFLSMKGDVAVFDVDEHGSDELAWTVYMNCLFDKQTQQNFLCTIEGVDAIFTVFVVYDEVMVYKLREPEMEWELVNDLGDKVLYVSHSSSFGVTAPVKSMVGNTINFAQLHDGSLVFYSLEDGKYHSFGGGNYSSNTAYDNKRLDFATWIMPSATNSRLPGEELTWCPNSGCS